MYSTLPSVITKPEGCLQELELSKREGCLMPAELIRRIEVQERPRSEQGPQPISLTHVKCVVLYAEQLGGVAVQKTGKSSIAVDVLEKQSWRGACQPQSLHMLRDYPAANFPNNGVICWTRPSSASVSDMQIADGIQISTSDKMTWVQ